MQECRTEEERYVEKEQWLAAKTKSFPQPSLSGNGGFYPWVGGWDFTFEFVPTNPADGT